MADQPAPTPGKTSVTEPFRSRFVHEGAERDMLGLERYGTALRTHNGRDAGRDAWEEWYDLGKYLEQLRIEHADALAEIERLRVTHAEFSRFVQEAQDMRQERDEARRALAQLVGTTP